MQNITKIKKEEITFEDFVETYCNNKCWMKKCEGIGLLGRHVVLINHKQIL